MYTEKYINVAVKNKKYVEAFQQTLGVIHDINQTLGEREKALSLLKKLEFLIDQINDSSLIGRFYLKQGGVFFNGKDYSKAIDSYTKSITNFTEKDSIFKADSYFFRGQVYFSTNNFFKALKDFEIALEFYTKLKDWTYVFYTRSDIINIYGANDFVEKSIKERKQLIADKIKSDITVGLSSDYSNLAQDLKKKKQYKEQENALFLAIKRAKEENNALNNISLIYANLCRYYLEHNNLNEADKYYQLAKESVSGSENYNSFYFNHLKGYYLFKNQKLNEAFPVLFNTLKKAEEQNSTQFIIDINKLISDIYEIKGNYSKANNHNKIYNRLKDSIFNIKKLNILSYYQSLHEATLKERKITQQQVNIDILIRDQKNKRLLLIILLTSSFFLIILIYLLLNRFYLKRKKKLQTIYSQNLLLNIDEERKRIAKDIHDSLGHKLLLIKHYDIANKNDLIDEAIDEIRIISKNLQPVQIQQIGITKSIKNLIHNLNQSSTNILLFGDIRNIDKLLSYNDEVNLYRIIQECLNNILKHSKADSSKVSIYYKNNHIILTIVDNGIGFNFQEKYKNVKSIGLKNLKTRVQLIKGILKISSLKNQGTTINIKIPQNEI
ncbi:ATP-binding protein [Tenacibaculum sp. ZS6-P6]|uniref:ATP-binding protein n=1 Tax=Tenacibaculum sp. ZS6-P6 TaxID=3447503 RepID=UPI003F9B4E28